jgi:predicted Ser/Thr protein kinase
MSDTEEKPIARPPELPAGAVLLKAAFAFPQSDLWLLPGSPARVWKTWYRGRSPLQRRMGRFLAAREARIMRALELTGRVPKVLDMPRADTIEMVALAGHTLTQAREDGRPLPGIDFYRELDAFVADMHAAGITHGDLRPNNVFYDPARPTSPMVIDFTQSLQFRVPPRFPSSLLIRMARRIDRARLAKAKYRMLGEAALDDNERRRLLSPPWYLRFGRGIRRYLYRPLRRRSKETGAR